jgi:S-adenosylmethionine synthetase
MKREFMFTCESVTGGHPDKLCDQISDAVVGRVLRQDPLGQVVAECAVSTGIVFMSVKLAAAASIDLPNTARQVIREVGYREGDFDAATCTVMTSVTEAPPAADRVDEGGLDEEGIERVTAREQVTLFGYACSHTPVLMPLPLWLSQRLSRRLAQVAQDGTLPYLHPDGKTQVGVEFRDRLPARIHSIALVAAPRGTGAVSAERLRTDLVDSVVGPVFSDLELAPDHRTLVAVNAEGPPPRPGPLGHAGLTGRKTAEDTYGEYARCSSAALSGKDPSRIDRAGAYAARQAAKAVVAAGLARECEVMLSYTIGQARPVSVEVETFGTGTMAVDKITRRVRSVFDFRPAAVIRSLQLRGLPGRSPDGFYQRLAAGGQMGRVELDLPWEDVTQGAAALR